MDPNLTHLWTLATARFALGPHSLHGPDHWQRVERNALAISHYSTANALVVRLFAVLHDSHRQNESHDPDHGKRAADWAKTLRGQQFDLPDDAFNTLCQALIYHDKGRTSGDPTIGTCWDADRLDLTRVGIKPAEKLMSTERGREIVREGLTIL